MPRLHDLPTPALLLDAAILERNVRAMAVRISGLGAALRPHAKTHKCVEVARLQAEHGALGLTVATIVEAKDFAGAGFDDITWAFPLPVSRLAEVIELARRITFRVLVESVEAVDALEAAARAGGVRVHVFLEVDCGYGRSGVRPETPATLALARRIAGSPHLIFDGVLTHAGHSYHARSLEARRDVAEQERAVTVGCAEWLRAAGVPVEAVSVGSTPSMTAARSLAGVTEARPGNYVFYDWMQAAHGVCAPDDVAVSVLATVISHQPGSDHAIVDAGALALSKDQGPGEADLRRGYGPVCAGLAGTTLDPALTCYTVSQEHGFVGVPGNPAAIAGRLKVGDRVRILPNHSCLTVAMFDAYALTQGETVVDHWPILRGR